MLAAIPAITLTEASQRLAAIHEAAESAIEHIAAVTSGRLDETEIISLRIGEGLNAAIEVAMAADTIVAGTLGQEIYSAAISAGTTRSSKLNRRIVSTHVFCAHLGESLFDVDHNGILSDPGWHLLIQDWEGVKRASRAIRDLQRNFETIFSQVEFEGLRESLKREIAFAAARTGISLLPVRQTVEEICTEETENQSPTMDAGSIPDDCTGWGVSALDVAMAICEGDIDAARDRVRAWTSAKGKKRIATKPIGKCPRDSRAQLYPLSGILSDAEIFFGGFTTSQKRRLNRNLQQHRREPRA